MGSGVPESNAIDSQCLGLIIAGPDGRIAHADAAALGVLGLSGQPTHIRALVAGLAALPCGEDGKFQGQDFKITAHAIPGGGAVLVVDCCSGAQGIYRSIFENSVYGTYRDTLDSKPLRCNPALARFNGYDTESNTSMPSLLPVSWYVDPSRSAEFRRLIETDGRVRDMVSEVSTVTAPRKRSGSPKTPGTRATRTAGR